MIGRIGASRTPDSAANRCRELLRKMEVALVDRPERLVLSVTEAAEMLGISRSLAYELVARGELPARRFGSRIVVLLRPLQRLLGGEPVDKPAGPSPAHGGLPAVPAPARAS